MTLEPAAREARALAAAEAEHEAGAFDALSGEQEMRGLWYAHQMFVSMGADGFAERAARELLATGERVRKRTTDAPARLTARETQIARLASDGLSNPEIAAQLFMSRRTVEYHLHKIFTKLAVSSRNQLHLALAGRRAEGSR